MKNEYKVILLACLVNKSKKEEDLLNDLISSNLNWEIIAGQLFHHRLSGYFIKGLNNEQKKYLFPEFKKTIDLLVKAQRVQVLEVINNINPILNDFDKENIRYTALKGLMLNASIYNPGDRRSNDSDIMIVEDDLDKADVILRKFGYIQSFMPNGEYIEASRKDKMIQRINYHDTVPYVKKHGNNLVDNFEIDINFHYDSKENNITKIVYEMGTEIYKNAFYQIKGLRWDTNLAYMCVHFFREGTSSLWTKERRDVILYKIIDIINMYRSVINENNLNNFIETIKELNLQKACYYTFYYIDQIYKDDFINQILDKIKPDELNFLNEVYLVEEKKTVIRKENYFETAFNLTFCLN